MKSAKQKKSSKAKTASVPVKDLQPTKDAKGGAQKKELEDPSMQAVRPPA